MASHDTEYRLHSNSQAKSLNRNNHNAKTANPGNGCYLISRFVILFLKIIFNEMSNVIHRTGIKKITRKYIIKKQQEI